MEIRAMTDADVEAVLRLNEGAVRFYRANGFAPLSMELVQDL